MKLKGKTHKIAVEMPQYVYERILKRAQREKKSFSAVAADLIACGLFDVEESEESSEKEKA